MHFLYPVKITEIVLSYSGLFKIWSTQHTSEIENLIQNMGVQITALKILQTPEVLMPILLHQFILVLEILSHFYTA